MNRESRAARQEREARRAALPAPTALSRRAALPRPPWTAQRFLYIALLWLVWGISMASLLRLGWHAWDSTLFFSVLLDPGTRGAGFKLLYWVSVALLIAIPIRLLADNLRMSLIPLLLGVGCAGFACLGANANLDTADQLGGHYLSTKRVMVRRLEQRHISLGRNGTSTHTVALLDNPMHAGQLIEFPQNWIGYPNAGESICIDLLEGQFGSVWGLLPKKCEQP